MTQFVNNRDRGFRQIERRIVVVGPGIYNSLKLNTLQLHGCGLTK